MRFPWQTSCHLVIVLTVRNVYMQDKSDVLLGGSFFVKRGGRRLCHSAGERFFRRVVAFEKLLFDFRHRVWRNFQPYTIFCHTYSNLIVFYVVWKLMVLYFWWKILYFLILVVVYMRGIFWICTSRQSMTISWSYRGVLEG